MQTAWSSEIGRERHSFTGEAKYDVAVIGGGLCGVISAYRLSRAGLKTVLLEAEQVASGQTRGTTAKITLCHGEILSHIEKNFGTDSARIYARGEMASIDEYERIISEENIDCSFTRLPLYLYALYGERRINCEYETAIRCGINCELSREIELPFEVSAGVRFDAQAQFDPIRFMTGILNGFDVYEGTRVIDLDGGKVICKEGVIYANHTVITTNYPSLRGIKGLFPLKLHRKMAHVCTFCNCKSLEGMYVGVDGGYNYRSFGDELIVSGESHVSGLGSGGAYERIRKNTLSHFKGATVSNAWSAEDSVSLDGIPYIGRIGSPKENVYVATGFGTWGMTTSMTAATIICDQICGRKNEAERLYAPTRLKMYSAADELSDSVSRAVDGILLSRIKETDETADIPLDFGMIVRHKGKKAAVYRDKIGELHVSVPYCPHMKCELSWNDDDKTWDCPCHGSRFDYDGKLLSGPSKENI